MNKQKIAFTLVELIVVITILAVLGTIAFLSFQGYSRDSRNTVRLNDMGLIEKTLELFVVQTGKFPIPDDTLDITYSGGTLWTQGYFGDETVSKLDRLSKVPKDPLFDLEYSYSLFNKSNKYQLGVVFEGVDYVYNTFSQANALSNNDSQSYVAGNFDLLDIKSTTGSTCMNLAVPSIIMNNPPVDGVLTELNQYNFVYSNGNLLPTNYESNIDIVHSGFSFQVDEVFNKCSVDSLSDVNSYILKLSSVYQQFSGVEAYDEIVNKPRTLEFIHKAIGFLRSNGITVSDDIVRMIDNAFIDTFTGADNEILVGTHISDTLSNWDFVLPSSNSGSYIISSNQVTKTNSSTDMITPILLKPKTSSDTVVSVDITDFNGGNLEIYSRYQDSNNFYRVRLNSSGYTVSKNIGGIITDFSNISSAIGNGSTIIFEVSGMNVKLNINGNEVENIIDTDIASIGQDIISLPNSGMVIDNYSLYFE